MSLAELPNYDQSRSAVPKFDRTPPQDLIAEQSVLGGMLLSKDAIGEVVEILRGRDFYRPAHELIFEVAPGEEKSLEAIVRKEMGEAYPLKAPLDVNVGFGRTWDEAAH